MNVIFCMKLLIKTMGLTKRDTSKAFAINDLPVFRTLTLFQVQDKAAFFSESP